MLKFLRGNVEAFLWCFVMLSMVRSVSFPSMRWTFLSYLDSPDWMMQFYTSEWRASLRLRFLSFLTQSQTSSKCYIRKITRALLKAYLKSQISKAGCLHCGVTYRHLVCKNWLWEKLCNFLTWQSMYRLHVFFLYTSANYGSNFFFLCTLISVGRII
jgi:hypothetical protein